MALDLAKAVNSVRDDLRKLYMKDPSTTWERPFVVIAREGGFTGYLDSPHNEDVIIGWLSQFRGPKKIEAVIVGRMVVKYAGTLDSQGNKRILEKAILVTGRDFKRNRTRISITPTKEHRDFRSEETIDKQGDLENPGLHSPDVTKKILDVDGSKAGYMTGQFQKEKVMDSNNGMKCALDPLIAGVLETERLEKEV